uniref:Odorant receptor OR9 n=1 Tax=Colaphellus bowringi TaxID=561076 RepID=A0A0S3J2Q0_9CUCU|nr:odorant receptor OR9 [Colaphellus bowringi]
MLTFSLIHITSLVQVSETLSFNLTQLAYLCKLLNFQIHSKRLLELEDFLRKTTLTNVTVEEEAIIRNTMKGSRRLATVYRSLCVIIVFLYALFPLIDENSGDEKKLPLPMWFPFDTNNHFGKVWFFEIFSIAIGAWTNSNLDVICVTMITLTTCQFNIMNSRLSNLRKSTDDVEEEDTVQKALKECVIHYNDIISFQILVETTFSLSIFGQFVFSVLVICMTGFQMLVISFKSVQFVLLLSYLLGQTCQIVMYCWYGQSILDSSEAINDACYSSEWFNCSKETQKMFLIIMERSKRPVKMRAGKFFFLNLDTLMSILKSSYSYFAVLRHIYSSKFT